MAADSIDIDCSQALPTYLTPLTHALLTFNAMLHALIGVGGRDLVLLWLFGAI